MSSVYIINTCTTHAVDKSKAQLQAYLKEEKELQINLVQALEMLRPNDWMITELKEKLLAQKPESSLSLTAPQRRQIQEILIGKRHMRINSFELYYYVLYKQLSSHFLCLLMTQLKWTTLLPKVSYIIKIVDM